MSFVIFASACTAADVVDKIVIVVNDQTITSSEIEAVMKPVSEELKKSYSGPEAQEKLKQARKDVIERLVEEKLIIQEAKKEKIEVANEEVELKLRKTMSKFPNKEAFQRALEAQGTNIWEVKKNYREQAMAAKMVRQYVRGHASVTPTEVRGYYQGHTDEFRLPDAVAASQILIKYKLDEEPSRTEKTAMQVAELLAAGADFAVVAKKYSEGINAAGGGYIGMVERGTMSKEIDDVIFNIKEGETSKPIKTKIGFAILKVNSIRKSQVRPFEEVKNQIEETLLDQNAKAVIGKWINELKEKAFISVKE